MLLDGIKRQNYQENQHIPFPENLVRPWPASGMKTGAKRARPGA